MKEDYLQVDKKLKKKIEAALELFNSKCELAQNLGYTRWSANITSILNGRVKAIHKDKVKKLNKIVGDEED